LNLLLIREKENGMSTKNENPPITPLLRYLTIIEVLVLIGAGVGLFFFTDLTRPQWPWEIRPFNARFVGAVYLTSMIAVAMMLVGGRWAPARLVLPMLFTFTFVVLIMTLLGLANFRYDRWATWVWFVLYIVLPINAAYHLWLYRRLRPVDPNPVPSPWRYCLRGMGVVLALYGLAQFFAPESASAFWPWKIDAFHGRMYSANFLTGAVGAFVLARAAAPIEYFTLGITYGVLGLFAIVGLVVVDASVRSVDWSAAGTWLWVVAFAISFIVGVALMGYSRASRNNA
jgi:hypothetical protein